MLTRIGWVAALLVILCTAPLARAVDAVFDDIADPWLIGWGAGPDGFIGTADDVPDGGNIFGTTSWTDGPPGNTYTDAVVTIPIPLVFVGGANVTTNFSFVGATQFLGFDHFNDLPSLLPHEIVTDLDGRQSSQFSLGVCASPGPCTPSNLVLESVLAGWLLLRGQDPSSLPGINPEQIDYLAFLASIAPSDWTAIMFQLPAVSGAAAVAALATSDPIGLPSGVMIDIKPGSDPNPVNPFAQGTIPVAILGTGTFDVSDVDVTTLAFGSDRSAPAHPQGGHFQDVNGDSLMDLLSHYRTQETGITSGDTEACVTGETLSGIPIEGCDAIATQTPSRRCGLGFELALILPGLMWLHRRRRRLH